MQAQIFSATGSILSFDVGERRIGVALADTHIRLVRSLATLEHTPDTVTVIRGLALKHQVVALVLGLPRGLDGQHTAQTAYVQAFANTLQPKINLPLYWQDEAVTSQQAEIELRQRGKPYKKGDIDALSAIYILEDFLRDHPEEEAKA